MRRGTTPIITIKSDGIDFTGFKSIQITFRQPRRQKLVKNDKSDTVVVTQNRIMVQLTQEQTLQFVPGIVYVEVRVKTRTGQIYPSQIASFCIKDILNTEVME